MRVALNGDSYSRANSYTLDSFSFRRKAMLRATLFLASVLAVACSGTGRICPTWQYLSNGTGQCECGSSLQDVVVCNKTQGTVGVMVGYCLTSDGNSSVVGHCLAEYINQEKLLGPYGNYKKVYLNLSEQERHACGFLNREGILCGQCKPKTSIHAYTYDMKCYPCPSDLLIEVVKYIGIAYVPLTLFLCIVVIFRISVTSPAMNVPILSCQLLSLPFVLRFIWQYALTDSQLRPFIQIFGTIYGIWNLDFFRLIVHPICLKLDIMQLIALDYLVAVYPLLLLVCVYGLVRAHDRGCRLVVRMWRPFLWCSARIRQQWNARHSIIDAFATFILLSSIKFLNTSIDLLVYSNVRNETGSYVGRYLYNNPTVEFFSRPHLPYAILALLVLVGLSLVMILILLYPMNWFQVLLNKCHLNSPGLRIFMECFQGYYRDRSDGGWECRYFAAVYPATRVLIYLLYSISYNSAILYVACIILFVVVIGAVLLVQPYKPQYRLHYKTDILILSPFVLMLLGVILISPHAMSDSELKLGVSLVCVCGLTPAVYFAVKCFIFFLEFLLKFSKKRGYQELTEDS